MTTKKTLGNIKMYSSEYTDEEKKAIFNYSKLFDFDLDIVNSLKQDGIELSNQSIQKEVELNRNIYLNNMNDFETGIYESDKHDNISNQLLNKSIRKDFLSKQCMKSILISKRQDVILETMDDLMSGINPTLENTQSKILLENEEFKSLLLQAKKLQDKIRKNPTSTRNRKTLQEIRIKANEFIN